MDNQKLNKGLLLLGWLIMMLSLLLSALLKWVDDDAFVKLQATINYKWMLLTLLIIILSLVYSLVYLKIFGVRSQVPIPEKICPKCKKPELEVVTSRGRFFDYVCKSCGFEHRTFKQNQPGY